MAPKASEKCIQGQANKRYCLNFYETFHLKDIHKKPPSWEWHQETQTHTPSGVQAQDGVGSGRGGWRGRGNVRGPCVPSSGLLDAVGSGKITLRTRSTKDKRQKRIFQASPRRKQGVPWERALGPAGKGHTQHPLSPAQKVPHIRKTRRKHRASHLILWSLSELAFPASPSHSLASISQPQFLALDNGVTVRPTSKVIVRVWTLSRAEILHVKPSTLCLALKIQWMWKGSTQSLITVGTQDPGG